MSLESVGTFSVPVGIVAETDEALRDAGRHGLERFVLWSGLNRGRTFEVRSCLHPDQTAYRLDSGLCVRIDGLELHRINVWLYSSQETLAVQVHSHPTDAFHSDTDSSFPVVTLLGGLSIVVPYFGLGGLAGQGVAVFRLTRRGWYEVPSSAAQQLVHVARQSGHTRWP